MSNGQEEGKTLPPQHQEERPGLESEMTPKPEAEAGHYRGSGKLRDKVAIITGGDSGIGRAVAVLYAREGADVVIVYLNEHEDANKTREMVEAEGRKCALIDGDVGDESFCAGVVQSTIDQFGKLDILVNNAAEQHPRESLQEISREQLERTFRTNIFSHFYMTKAALDHLKEGATIINTASVVPYKGSPELIDYGSTKGAIVAFTRCLAVNLAEKQIRVNAVAPGPIWTPLIPSTFPEEKVESFGANTLLGRPGQPEEVAPSYVFLASNDSSFMTGHVLHVDGGQWLGD